MPIYEYVCSHCHSRFEKYVRSWGEATACPECQSTSVEKQLSNFALGGNGGGERRPATAVGGCCGGSCGCAH